MLSTLTKIRGSKNWDKSNSSDKDEGKDYPGGGTAIQLLVEPVKILGGLPAYLCYGGGEIKHVPLTMLRDHGEVAQGN